VPARQLPWRSGRSRCSTRHVGASERTLARSFLADTGIPFGRWRTLLRLPAALPALAAGQPVGNVARHVGYETPSAFVAAFHRETGMTPAAYFRLAP
jgi:AraC-like DNA-binding protein